MGLPKAFVSYSWEGDEHKDWVRQFATRLRTDNVDTTLDQWHAVPGDQLPAFMETAVRENDFVLVVCTPRYKVRSDSRKGGVGYEGDIMTAEVYNAQNQRKFIPILRKGEWTEASPSWMVGKYYIDLRGNPYSHQNYEDLLSTLQGRRPKPPPLGGEGASNDVSVANSAIRIVLEVACILDLLVSRASEIQYVGYTFGESRRILDVIRTLRRRLKPRLTRVQLEIPSEVFEELRQLFAKANTFISEANVVLPTSQDDRYSLSTDYLTRDQKELFYGWDALKPRLLPQHSELVSFEEMLNDESVIYPLMGFSDASHYQEFLAPRTETMIRNAGLGEVALLETLVERRIVNQTDLVEEGFPKGMIVEVFNSLMRDSFLKHKSGEFTLTGLGSKLISDLLVKKRSAS